MQQIRKKRVQIDYYINQIFCVDLLVNFFLFIYLFPEGDVLCNNYEDFISKILINITME